MLESKAFSQQSQASITLHTARYWNKPPYSLALSVHTHLRSAGMAE